MVEYTLYLDDGGHPDDQPFLVAAGYAASESQWEEFASKWRAAMKRLGVVFPFHMTDFMKSPMTSFKRDQILSSLRALISSYTLRPFVCAVDMAAYKRVNEEFTLEECHGAPFAITCRAMAKEVHLWEGANLSRGDHLLTFVEEGTKHFGEMEQVFKRDRLALPRKVPKALPAVQPCDILAWETFNWLRAGSPSRMGKNLDRLVRPIRRKQNFGGILYEKDLRRLCAETNVYRRADMPSGIDPIRFGGGGDAKRVRRRTIR